MDIIKHKFGERLKTIRKIKGFTQEKLSEQIGVNLRQLARIEAGESFISSETLLNICIALGISPNMLFDFDILDETIMTGTGAQMHFNVIKDGNLIQLVPKKKVDDVVPDYDYNENLKDLDKRMKLLSMKMKKEITIDELQDGVVYLTKIFKPSGQVEIKNQDSNNYEVLKNKIMQIANDSIKIEYLNTALESLTNKKALDELKILIRGIELTLN